MSGLETNLSQPNLRKLKKELSYIFITLPSLELPQNDTETSKYQYSILKTCFLKNTIKRKLTKALYTFVLFQIILLRG